METLNVKNIDIGIARFAHGNPAGLATLKKETLSHLKRHKDDCNHTYILGHIYYVEENYAAAEECFKKCARLNKSAAHYRTALAFVYRHQGRYEESDDILFGASDAGGDEGR